MGNMMDENMPRVPGSASWRMERQLHKAEQQRQALQEADRALRENPSQETADAYLDELKKLTKELEQLHKQIDPKDGEAERFWIGLTKFVTGHDQPVW